MRKLIYVILTISLFSACAVTKQQNSVIGAYSGQTQQMGSFVPRGEMNLSLQTDKTFSLNWLNVDYSGTWEGLDENHILLKFDEITDPAILLRSGVISDREKKIRILSKNKLLFESWVLRKEK